MSAPTPAPVDPNSTAPVHSAIEHMNRVLNQGLVRGFVIVAHMEDGDVMTGVVLDLGGKVTSRHCLIGGLEVAKHDFIEQRFERKASIDAGLDED